MGSLIIYRKSPPLLNGHIDWTAIGKACGLEAEFTAELKKQLRPGLDAIIRWLGTPPAMEQRRGLYTKWEEDILMVAQALSRADVVQQHYGRFLPQDKAALAAKILNQVWEAT